MFTFPLRGPFISYSQHRPGHQLLVFYLNMGTFKVTNGLWSAK